MTTLLDELIAHRDNKKDKRVFGLVLQGGGMRAVYSAGAAAPLITYGVVDSFDHVVGSSAGAINGAYMLGSDPETLRTYTDDLTNKNFVNLLRRDKRVDIDYLVDMVLQHKRPLNLANLRAAHAQLHVVMTGAKNGRKVVVSDHHQFGEIYEEFRATAALPLLYDKKVLVAGKYFIDGGVADLLPLDVAIKLGCTDIVVIMTQQLASYDFSKRHARLANRLMRRFATEQAAAVRAKLPTDERLRAI
jgi:predicted patatin/cPLA2 family phospholipase